jgi:hypothetical protein
MFGFYPMRRVLGLPAAAWPVLSAGLILLAWALPMPGKLAEPADRQTIFREPVAVTPEGKGFRFVPFGQYAGVTPLWAVNTSIRDEWTVRCPPGSLLPGFYQRQSRWTYALSSNRLDDAWQNDREHLFLPTTELDELRPAIVEELEQRAPGQHLGQRLERLLQDGLQESSSVCVQNAVILLGWILLGLALVAVLLMFVKPRASKDLGQQASEP